MKLLHQCILHSYIQGNRIQWNPSITDTFGDQHFVRYSKMSLTQGLPVYISGRRGMRNPAVQYNVAAFSGPQKLSVIRSSGVSAIQGLLKY